MSVCPVMFCPKKYFRRRAAFTLSYIQRSQAASPASNHEMRPVSGDDLVTAALQSSLARAQKNYKLSNCKQLCKSPGKFVKKPVQAGEGEESGVVSAVKKSKALKFQSEFDLWIEQAQEVSFTLEGFTNGVTVPEDIECLNSSSVGAARNNYCLQKSVLEPVALLQKNKKKAVGETSVKESILKKGKVAIANGETTSVLKGKEKSKTLESPVESSFELFKKLNESRKLKKKLGKLGKRLLKEGYTQEETRKLIGQAEDCGEGVGAILQKLRQIILQNRKGKESNTVSVNCQGKTKKTNMKDLSTENGESSASVTENHSTHHSRPLASTSSSMSSTSPRINGGSANNSACNNSPGSSNQHQLPQPKRILFPREKIIPGYVEKMPVGAGFYNMGNSCYLNASLQAVFHVPAFINWLKHDLDHRKNCQDSMRCIVCAMRKTLDSATVRGSPSHSAIRPVEIINRLRSICRHFSHGRQEDAHEFLRYLFESMERSYLTAINCLRLDNRSKETNPLGQIFGGYLRTEVTCAKCHYVSTTFQPTAELQLDIRHVTTLEDAILNHFKKERLDNNDYKCEKCRNISPATKQFSLEIPPIVLCLQLKRFTLFGTKIAKRIHCNRSLDMSKFMHKSKQLNGLSVRHIVKNLKYRLVALVTHLGSSPNCGHYTAIAEASNGQFYQFDDSYVHQVTLSNALNNDAYVIIYEMDRRCTKSPESNPSSSSVSSTATSSYATNVTNLYPSSTITSSSSSSSTVTQLFPKKVPSTLIPKISSSTSSGSSSSTATASNVVQKSKTENEVKASTNGSSSDSVNGSPSPTGNGSLKSAGLERKMISFGIRPPNITPKKITILRPGAALTNSSKLGQSSSNGINNTSKNLASSSSSLPSGSESHKTDQTIKLVPYNDDEESDKDENGRVSSNGNTKRLKSPDNRKQSPGRNNVQYTPATPPKSPKPATSQNAPAGPTPSTCTSSSATQQDRSSSTNSPKIDVTPASSTSKLSLEISNSSVQRDGIKRKAPADEETTPRKPRSHRRRHSSSPSTSSTSSRSTSSSSESKRNNKSKRKRGEESSPSKSSEKKASSSVYHNTSSNSNEHNNTGSSRRDRESSRESHSQERDRERRRDRNPSRSRSPSVDVNGREKTGSSIDRRRENTNNSGSFDVAHLRQDNMLVGWDGRKTALSRSMEEERKRTSEKSFDEEYDDEFDEGRTKKVRRSRSLPRESDSGIGNRFQSIDDKKKQINQWSSLLDGYGPGFRRSGGGSNGGSAESRSWSSGGGDDTPRDNRGFLPRPNSSNGISGSRPRHSSSNGSTHLNYSRSSQGRMPYRNGHHNGGGANHFRSQSHGSYHHNNNNHGNKHWGNDRSRH